MKRVNSFLGLGLLSVLLLSSCVTTVKTARTAATSSDIKSVTVADLKVTDHRISYTMTPSKELQRAGLANVKQAALQEALTKNGNADVMLEPEYVVSMKNKFILGKEVTSVTVTGRPAYYENFRKLNDSVWHTPGFYGKPNVTYVCKHCQGDNADGCCDGDYDGGNASAGQGVLGTIGNLLGLGKKHNYADGDIRRTGMGFNLNLVGGHHDTTTKIDGDKHTSDGEGFLGALGTIGLQANPWWWFGVGSGWIYGWDGDTQIVPIFGNVRVYFSKHKNSFFYDFKMGGSFEVGEKTLDGGLFTGSAIGYSFGAFEVALQAYNQVFDINEKHYYGPKPDINSTYIGLNLGLKF